MLTVGALIMHAQGLPDPLVQTRQPNNEDLNPSVVPANGPNAPVCVAARMASGASRAACPCQFQFGMNWSAYSRYAGDIFGAPLAIEALLAFFLESTFLGLWIFSWDRLPPRLHAACMWLAATPTIHRWLLIAPAHPAAPASWARRFPAGAPG